MSHSSLAAISPCKAASGCCTDIEDELLWPLLSTAQRAVMRTCCGRYTLPRPSGACRAVSSRPAYHLLSLPALPVSSAVCTACFASYSAASVPCLALPWPMNAAFTAKQAWDTVINLPILCAASRSYILPCMQGSGLGGERPAVQGGLTDEPV